MLSILGIVVIVVASIHTYRSARDTGRRAVLWLFAVLAVGLGLQFIAPFMIALIFAVVYVILGRSQQQIADDINSWGILIGIAFLIISVVGMLLIAKRAAVVPDEPAKQPSPPPPPTFGE